MGNNGISAWNDEIIARLKELWPQMSASEVRATLNTEFRTTFSRNAVIGKATRIGIAGSNGSNPKPRKIAYAGQVRSANTRPVRINRKAVSVPALRQKRDEAKAPHRKGAARHAINEAAAQEVAKEIEAASIVPDAIVGVPYPDLEEHQCAWPLAGSGMQMICCGNKRYPGKSYCATHSIKAGAR